MRILLGLTLRADDNRHVAHVNMAGWHFEPLLAAIAARFYICRECWRIRTQQLQLRALRRGDVSGDTD
jgi:hypothetical protein